MKIAEFQKISFDQFYKDSGLCETAAHQAYESILIPKRATSGSAGYDFYSPIRVELNPGESIRISTGIRCRIDDGYVLKIYPRSSMGFKYQMYLLNTVGIIDSDYYNADNEGHIMVGIVNNGEKKLTIEANDRFVQGIFLKYFLAEEEENSTERHGGFGSTG